MKENKKEIIISSDHAGYRLKEFLKVKLQKDGFKVVDLGTYNMKAIDYPDVVIKGAEGISSGKYSRGIFICGSGIGIAIAANRYKKVRAAVIWNKKTAIFSRRHNDTNVIVFAGRMIRFNRAYKLFKIWWDTDFEDEERHVRRVNKLGKIGK
ncbi:MAG: RpiB/LacA/LacB family sugar-phosphate isomerase [Spirochaetes bacterium]|nr:RpiB/LacA/LacB family sugar-phosphate isomerase [Spirochaetota bacterium]